MSRRVFIKVVGFSDVERHALNTVFRLSEERETSYTLWGPEAPAKPELALLDGLTYEARLEAESPANRKLKIVWVGDDPPQETWRAFQRPIVWTEVVQAMDQLFAPADLDFDLEFGGDDASANGPDTQPSQLEEPGKRALIAASALTDRLYFRAKLALARMPVADEAETAAQALELLRSNAYQVALVDFELPGGAGWAFVKQLKAGDHPVPHVIVTKTDPSLPERFIRARLAGATALFEKPPDPEKLGEVLDRV